MSFHVTPHASAVADSLTHTGSAPNAQRLIRNGLLAFVVLALVGWLPLLFPHAFSQMQRPIYELAKRYSDLSDYTWKAQHISGPVFGGPGPTFNYPAPAAWVFAFFVLSSHVIRLYTACLLLAYLIAAFCWFRLLRGSLQPLASLGIVLGYTLLGAPIWFAYDRGNLEWINAFFVAMAITFFVRRSYMVSAVFVGLAVCIKPFPILFLLLFLYRKKFKEIAVAICLAAVTILIALKALGPSIVGAYKGLQYGLNDYLVNTVQAVHFLRETRVDHALMAIVRFIVLMHMPNNNETFSVSMTSHSLPLWQRLDLWYRFFALLGAAILLTVAWKARRKPALNQILAITVCVVLLPFAAAEYTLMALYAPLALYLVFLLRDAQRSTMSHRQTVLVLALFSLLLAPLGTEFSYASGLVKCFCLIALLICAMCFDMPMTLFGEQAALIEERRA